jgi:maltooligosyltrehalose trehalohydrolase
MPARKAGPSDWALDPGTRFLSDGNVRFRVWAPALAKTELVLIGDGKERVPLESEPSGYRSAMLPAKEGTRYAYSLGGGRQRPDPVSRSQPEGVHGPSELVNPASFRWSDSGWKGVAQKELLVYELHVGTCTREGTFESLIPRLKYLAGELGVTAVELMPVAQFPGGRNWGYDGVCMYAPQDSYGGSSGLNRLVDECHRNGLAVILDVVYNHLGPEGNYLAEFGPYFSDKYRTPWGPAINYDSAGCDEVRRFVVNNALYWIVEHHVDGLRLDAVQGIFDFSPTHILAEIGEAVHDMEGTLRRELHVIAESDLNDPKIVLPRERGGYALDAQWSDDFHHSVHAVLTGERFGYYQDFGEIGDVAKALRDGFVYDGRYSSFRGKSHGGTSKEIPAERLVVFLQDHDQVGNRPDGRRLSALIGRPALEMAAALLLLSPYVPMLFMGEEYAETAPFQYFISHTDPGLVEAVRAGRMKEFESHRWGGAFEDPYAESTFESSKLNPRLREQEGHREVFRHYRELIRLRKGHPSLRNASRENMEVRTLEDSSTLLVRRWEPGEEEALMVFVLGGQGATIHLPWGPGWERIYSSDGGAPVGPGSKIDGRLDLPPYGFAIFVRKGAPDAPPKGSGE